MLVYSNDFCCAFGKTFYKKFLNGVMLATRKQTRVGYDHNRTSRGREAIAHPILKNLGKIKIFRAATGVIWAKITNYLRRTNFQSRNMKRFELKIFFLDITSFFWDENGQIKHGIKMITFLHQNLKTKMSLFQFLQSYKIMIPSNVNKIWAKLNCLPKIFRLVRLRL